MAPISIQKCCLKVLVSVSAISYFSFSEVGTCCIAYGFRKRIGEISSRSTRRVGTRVP